jgi:hypothetical protein
MQGWSLPGLFYQCIWPSFAGFAGNAVPWSMPEAHAWQPQVSKFVRTVCGQQNHVIERQRVKQEQAGSTLQLAQTLRVSQLSALLDEGFAGILGSRVYRLDRGVRVCCAAARGSGTRDAPAAVTPQTLWEVRHRRRASSSCRLISQVCFWCMQSVFLTNRVVPTRSLRLLQLREKHWQFILHILGVSEKGRSSEERVNWGRTATSPRTSDRRAFS